MGAGRQGVRAVGRGLRPLPALPRGLRRGPGARSQRPPVLLHLWQVARAVAEGIPLVGYLHWSLLDNYEWADGFTARFGLVAADYATQQRTIRESARRLAEIIRRNEL
ncbi:MAG: glycosyl hydrolase family protein [Candidatus Eisenbacteria bacterium]|uniref:Glycosyl hydrolase family protein n=1 Tax=Eiseniibacteriota bacterium TaxID=2212470 RepID=A0A538SC66_UNCEI|nr:MAG: glycosyl hydrolase family protein [Candidatus Eisenbacteria bacterium]